MQSQQARATGTYDVDLDQSVFAKCFAKSRGQNQNQAESTGETNRDSDQNPRFQWARQDSNLRPMDMSPLLNMRKVVVDNRVK